MLNEDYDITLTYDELVRNIREQTEFRILVDMLLDAAHLTEISEELMVNNTFAIMQFVKALDPDAYRCRVEELREERARQNEGRYNSDPLLRVDYAAESEKSSEVDDANPETWSAAHLADTLLNALNRVMEVFPDAETD